jgi:hypothetical protein
LIHVDVKKLGRIRPVVAGGHWAARPPSRTSTKKTKIGYDYVHTAIDDHTRLTYSEIHDDERDATSAGFLHRALVWVASHGITVERVLTDNAMVCRHGHRCRNLGSLISNVSGHDS